MLELCKLFGNYSIHVNKDKQDENDIIVKEERSRERYIKFPKYQRLYMKLGEGILRNHT